MNYRALFVGGPLDGQERVTQQDVQYVRAPVPKPSPIRPVGDYLPHEEIEVFTYELIFAYGGNTLVYSAFKASQTLDLLFERYMKWDQHIHDSVLY
jgi:hypothetical protein